MKKSSTRKSKQIGLEVLSLVIFALGVFVLVALITHHPSDPSFLSNSNAQAQNACGWVGSTLSALLLYSVGLGSFLVPAALFFLSTTLYQKETPVRITGTLIGMLFAVISLTVFLTFQWPTLPYAGTEILTGGAFGTWLTHLIMKPLNAVGGSILSLLVFCLAIALSTPVSIALFFGRFLKSLFMITYRLCQILLGYIAYFLGVILVKFFYHMKNLLVHLSTQFAQHVRDRIEALRALREQNQLAFVSAPGSKETTTSDHPKLLPSFKELGAKFKAQKKESSDEDVESEEETDELTLLGPSNSNQPEPTLGNFSKNLSQSTSEPEIFPLDLKKRNEAVKQKSPSFSKSKAKPTHWKLPKLEFLKNPPKIETEWDKNRLIENSQILKNKLNDFGIDGEIKAVRPGPVITLYEFKPGPGVKVSKIVSLADDIAMALSAENVRILGPIRGKNVVGIEIPSDNRETVLLRELLQEPDYYTDRYTIPIVMGKDIGGQPVLSDLSKMPHLLCAGQTGSGKSVFMNSLICSLLYRFTPEEMRMILVDPKFIEFRAYQDTPHLMLPVVDDPKEAATALKWAVREMERRYRILALLGVRNLASFNQKVEEMGSDVVHDILFSEENQDLRSRTSKGSDWINAFEPNEDGTPHVSKLPYIVLVIDELADLMMVAKKDVEVNIARIAQKARAAGIHLIIATQRPSTDVITGLIKANLPTRVSFQLASHVDSKTIIDRGGAERLLGQGDMLFVPPASSQIQRLHGAFIDDDEINKVTKFLKSQGKPHYRDEILIDEDDEETEGQSMEDEDELFEQAVDLVQNAGHASASFIQRHLKVGYNRAARMIEAMEARGIVGPADGSRPREVLTQ